VTFCGTLDYMSPEVLKGDNQSYEVDTWAVGVLLYELFHDTTPFKGKTPRELLNNILERKIKIGPMVPKDAKDLLQKLLAVEPTKRITLEEVREHPFVLRYPSDLQDSEKKEEIISEKETEISEPDLGSKVAGDKDSQLATSKRDPEALSSKSKGGNKKSVAGDDQSLSKKVSKRCALLTQD
jgi:serine/threonine protein kinase